MALDTYHTVYTLHNDGSRTERRCFGEDGVKSYLNQVRKDWTLIKATVDRPCTPNQLEDWECEEEEE